MKVVITVTSVYDFPDDAVVEDIVDGGEVIGQCVAVNGRKLQPIVDFSPADDEDELDDGVFDMIDDSLEAEEYTIMPIGGDKDND